MNRPSAKMLAGAASVSVSPAVNTVYQVEKGSVAGARLFVLQASHIHIFACVNGSQGLNLFKITALNVYLYSSLKSIYE